MTPIINNSNNNNKLSKHQPTNTSQQASQPTQQPADRPASQPYKTNQPADRPASHTKPSNQPADRPASHSINQTCRLVGWLVLYGWLVGRLVGWLVLFGWLVGQLVGWLAGICWLRLRKHIIVVAITDYGSHSIVSLRLYVKIEYGCVLRGLSLWKFEITTALDSQA